MTLLHLHAGHRLRAYVLYTDGYQATILQPGDLPAVAIPQPAHADEQLRIDAVINEIDFSLPKGSALGSFNKVSKVDDFSRVPSKAE